MLKKFIILLVLLFTSIVIAQKKEKVLLSIDGQNVYNNEFIRVYEKNKDIVVENDTKDFDDYFNLFLEFKLKLKQAHDLKLDTAKSYINELSKYREQLITPYLQSPELTDSLINEAYARTITEVRASHILIRLKPNAKPNDTLIAYHKIMEARNKIIKGESFDNVARKYSEDPSVKTNGGDLGYFSAFSMVYEFENIAYDTKVGEVSLPFRTQFGYHIVKVIDKRKSPGEREVAHIMIKKNPEDSTYAQGKILDIYKKLNQGDDFSKIAIEHSDDMSSAKKGGKLPRFGTGRMIKPFEDVAFALKNEGDYSKPFKTKYGWHILKLLKIYPVKTLNELHDHIESKIKNGSRSKYVEKALADKLTKNYTVKENKDLLNAFYNGDSHKMNSENVLLTIDNKKYMAKDFNNFILENKNKNIENLYLEFKDKKIIDYYKSNLEFTNQEFATIYKEYQDGLLLFALLQKKIWDKAEKDSLGLLDYFNNHKEKYAWKKRGELSIASCNRKEKAELVKKYWQDGKTNSEIKTLVNEGATIHVLFSNGTLEEGNPKLPDNYELQLGISQIYQTNQNSFILIKVNSILPVKGKELNESRGEVINDYQNYLEKLWVKNLKATYDVKINKKNFKKLKTQFSSLK